MKKKCQKYQKNLLVVNSSSKGISACINRIHEDIRYNAPEFDSSIIEFLPAIFETRPLSVQF